MTLYSLCTLATCDVCVMKGPIVEIHIDRTVEDIEQVYNIDFLRRKIARVDVCHDHIRVWLEEDKNE